MLECPTVITSKDLIKFFPDWKNRFSTLEEWKEHSIEHNYERIQIKVEFLATSNNIFLNQKDIIGWDNDWTYGLRGSHCILPKNSFWRNQVIEIYKFLSNNS